MTDNQDYVTGVASYFSSNQLGEFVKLLRTLEQRSHIHIFVNTTVHPVSLEAVLKGYLKRIGLPTNRGNEILIGGTGQGTLHGIHPTGTPHFDMKWNYKPGVVLEPMEDWQGECGQNLIYWDQDFMRHFYRGFQWATVGPRQKAEIEAYFDSPHWHRSFELMREPGVVHLHPHVQTNVHPSVIEPFLLRAIERKKDWKLHRMLPNVYHCFGAYYGKFMLLFDEPEVSIDVDWVYDQNSVLAPYTGERLLQDEPGYTIVRDESLDEALARNAYRRLTDAEIDNCLDAIGNLAPAW